MQVNQQFHGPVTNVYNVEGTLILSQDSSAEDLARELSAMRSKLEAAGLDPTTRKAAEAEIAAAEAEAASPAPKGGTIKRHLDAAAGTLESATSVASSVAGLAKTLFSMGKWAAVLLA